MGNSHAYNSFLFWFTSIFAYMGNIITAYDVLSGFSTSLKFPLTMPSPKILPILPLSQLLTSLLQLSPSNLGNAFIVIHAFQFRL